MPNSGHYSLWFIQRVHFQYWYWWICKSGKMTLWRSAFTLRLRQQLDNVSSRQQCNIRVIWPHKLQVSSARIRTFKIFKIVCIFNIFNILYFKYQTFNILNFIYIFNILHILILNIFNISYILYITYIFNILYIYEYFK
jgi:hypothetical protein